MDQEHEEEEVIDGKKRRRNPLFPKEGLPSQRKGDGNQRRDEYRTAGFNSSGLAHEKQSRNVAVAVVGTGR